MKARNLVCGLSKPAKYRANLCKKAANQRPFLNQYLIKLGYQYQQNDELSQIESLNAHPML